MDGGDIVYERLEKKDGVFASAGRVLGLPKSHSNLKKMGIENMLKHYVPEVKEIRQVDV